MKQIRAKEGKNPSSPPQVTRCHTQFFTRKEGIFSLNLKYLLGTYAVGNIDHVSVGISALLLICSKKVVKDFINITSQNRCCLEKEYWSMHTHT